MIGLIITTIVVAISSLFCYYHFVDPLIFRKMSYNFIISLQFSGDTPAAAGVYDDIPIICELKNVVEQFIDDGVDEIQYSQIYSWFDLALDGCMSPIDYPALATMHAQGEFQFHFLWGCVENCCVLWCPSVDPSGPHPAVRDWPILEFDNEGSIGYVGTAREAVARLIKRMEEEILRDGKEGTGLDAFVRDVVSALELTRDEIEDSQVQRPIPPQLAEHIANLSSCATME